MYTNINTINTTQEAIIVILVGSPDETLLCIMHYVLLSLLVLSLLLSLLLLLLLSLLLLLLILLLLLFRSLVGATQLDPTPSS